MASTIKVRSVVLLCVAVFQLTPQATSATKPGFCRQYNCPEFSVENKTKDYEKRTYIDGGSWIKTSTTNYFFPNYYLFKRLFGYINGNNAEDKKFNMTVPVVMKTLQNNHIMWFYLGRGVYPKPKDVRVKVHKYPAFTVYVRGVERLLIWWSWEAVILRNALKKDDIKVKGDYNRVGYSHPFDVRNTYKEIWIFDRNSDF